MQKKRHRAKNARKNYREKRRCEELIPPVNKYGLPDPTPAEAVRRIRKREMSDFARRRRDGDKETVAWLG